MDLCAHTSHDKLAANAMISTDEAVALLSIQRRIEAACARVGRLPNSVTLIAATKTVSAARLKKYFEAGLRDAGENYVQEGAAKIEALGREVNGEALTWHLIGALQRNKARDAVRLFDVIHSVDRLSLAKALNAAAAEIGKVQNVLLQVNIGDESSKAGCAVNELPALWRACHELPNLSVRGLMALPPYESEPESSRPYFRRLRELRKALHEPGRSDWNALSMGMSNDFEIAIEEGATMVRVGTALFGARKVLENMEK
jgi:pyridoxal phosphate enzyme (YggS family)